MEPEISLPHSQVPAASPYPEPDRSSPPPPNHTTWRSILILSSLLLLDLLSGLFPSGFPTKTLYIPFLSPIRATRSAHFIVFYLITWIIFGEQLRSLSSSLCSFLHSPVTSSLLDPNMFNISLWLTNTNHEFYYWIVISITMMVYHTSFCS